MIYCEECRGTNIEQRGWVNVNTLTFDNCWCEDDDYWCVDCALFVDTTEEEIE